MGKTIKGFCVTLDEGVDEEYAKYYINAISMLKGVCLVKANVKNIDDHINQAKIKHELRQKLFESLSD